MCLAVSMEHQHVTDGRTDGQAYFYSIVHAMHNIACYKLMLKTEVTWKKTDKKLKMIPTSKTETDP